MSVVTTAKPIIGTTQFNGENVVFHYQDGKLKLYLDDSYKSMRRLIKGADETPGVIVFG